MHRIDVETILRNIIGTRIGIIGDSCLDVYWNIDKEKIDENSSDNP